MKVRRLSGDNGSPIIDDTNAHTNLNVEAINIISSTTFSVCTGVDNNGNAYNFKTEMNWDGTLTANHSPLTVPRNYKITAITLTSGEIVIY